MENPEKLNEDTQRTLDRKLKNNEVHQRIAKAKEQKSTTNTGEKKFVANVEGYSYGTAPDSDDTDKVEKRG